MSCVLVDQTSSVNRLKTLESSLRFLLDCQQPLTSLTSQLTDDAADDVTLHNEAMKLASIIESRLQATLLNLVKNSSTTGKHRYTELRSLVMNLLQCTAYIVI